MVLKSDKIPSDIYTTDYFLHHRGGSDAFIQSQGRELCDAHKFAIKIAHLKPADKVLDLGCGCGEIALNAAVHARSVLAIDYSKDAIELALKAREAFDQVIQEKVTFFQVQAEDYELQKDSFDVVYFIDVIEHLVQEQIDTILASIYQCLKPGGRLIVHTWPNRWHREITYPLSYYMGKISGKNRPKTPKKEYEQLMHIKEQSPYELWDNLRRAGFDTKVFLRHGANPGRSPGQLFYWFIHAVPPFKWLYCDNIWAVGIK